MRNYNIKSLLIVAFPLLWAACADLEDYSSAYDVEKPGDVSKTDYLNSFGLLTDHIDVTANPNFVLALATDYATLSDNANLSSILSSNFQGVSINTGFAHAECMDENNALDYTVATNIVNYAMNNGTLVHAGSLCQHTKQNYQYLNALVADVIIPGNERSGKVLVHDFEDLEIGTSFKMTGGGEAIVANDPDGQSGKVLHIGTTSTGSKAAYSIPVFNVTLPEGVTLGDCIAFVMDFKTTSTNGLFGNGMRMRINDGPDIKYGNASSFGCSSGKWNRGGVALDFATANLSEEQKKLTTFTIAAGTHSGEAIADVDNIYITWKQVEEGETIIKTPAEKKEILLKQLKAYIAGMMEVAATKITRWDIASCPMSDIDGCMLRSASNEANAASSFYWPDYLGENYVQDIVAIVRAAYAEYAEEGSGKLQLFVDEYGLEQPGSRKLERLLQMMTKWEADGITKIDGIGTQMHLEYSLDANQQKRNEEAVAATLTKLAATGKLIRISDLNITVVQANGIEVSESKVNFEQQIALSRYYNYVLNKYFELIPAVQRAGITLHAVVGTLGLWDKDFNRQVIYGGVYNGLAGKTN